MTHVSSRARRVLAPVLLGLALVALVAPSVPHDHEGPSVAHGARGVASFSAGATHPDAPAHVEPTRPLTVRPCEVCLLRAQTRGTQVLDGVAGTLDGESPGLLAGDDPRVASLGVAGPRGSRGPPPIPVVF